MSNGRPFRRELADALGPLDGARIPGGCDHCAARTTVTRTPTGRLVITTEHDTTCPRRTP